MVYSQQYTNSTTIQYGYLNMILPFITVITTPFVCSMADRYRKHRSYFTISLMCAMFALCSYAALPLIMNTAFSHQKIDTADEQKQGLHIGAWIFFCLTSLLTHLSMGVNNCLSDSFAVLQAEEMKISFGRIIVWGTFGWASSALALCGINQLTFLPRLLPGILFGVLLLTIDIIIVSFWNKNSDFILDFIPSSAAQTLTGSSTHSAFKEPSDYMPSNESAKINIGSGINKQDGSKYIITRSPLQILKSSFVSGEKRINQVALIIRGIDDEHLKNKTSINIPITKQNILKDSKEDQVDKATSEIPTSSIKTIDSDFDANESQFSNHSDSSGYSKLDKLSDGNKTLATTDSLTGLAGSRVGNKSFIELQELNRKKIDTTAQGAAEAIDLKLIKHSNKFADGQVRKRAEIDEKFATSFRMQLILLGIILKKRRSFIRYLILFILAGFFMSMHWNYFFLYLEQIYRPKFEFISAFSMVSQSLLGELPFFILSKRVINFFGRSHTLSISIITIGIRFILYRHLLPNVNMYFIILSDCFQGPNYGLFYVIMTEVGLEYSFCDDDTINILATRNELDKNNSLQINTIRLSLRSTVQSVAFACYEGLGVGLGSIVGGWLVHTYGFNVLWTTMAIASISVGILNIILEFFWSEDDDTDDEINDHQLQNTLKRIDWTKSDNNNGINFVRSSSPSESNDVRKEFEEAARKGTLQTVTANKSFPSPIPMSPFKFQQSPAMKLEILARLKAAEGKKSPLTQLTKE